MAKRETILPNSFAVHPTRWRKKLLISVSFPELSRRPEFQTGKGSTTSCFTLGPYFAASETGQDERKNVDSGPVSAYIILP